MGNNPLIMIRHLLWSLLLIFCNCTQANKSLHSTTSNQSSKQITQPQSDQSLTPVQFEFIGHDQRLIEAWRQFANDGRYRMARAEDFHLPAEVLSNDGRFVKYPDLPCIQTEINQDSVSGSEFAAIIVDRTLNDEARFGLVIFSGVGDERRVPQLYWLYREQDLSKAVLSQASSRVVLTDYNEKGALSKSCVIKWDPRLRKYSCDRRL